MEYDDKTKNLDITFDSDDSISINFDTEKCNLNNFEACVLHQKPMVVSNIGVDERENASNILRKE